MKYKALLMIALTVSAFGTQADFMRGVTDGCAIGVSGKNAMGNAETVMTLCTQCVENAPLPGIDKTDVIISSMAKECSKKYFETRAKKQ